MPSIDDTEDFEDLYENAPCGYLSVSPDGLIYTFKIRSGLKWSDGTPIDANTFAYS